MYTASAADLKAIASPIHEEIKDVSRSLCGKSASMLVVPVGDAVVPGSAHSAHSVRRGIEWHYPTCGARSQRVVMPSLSVFFWTGRVARNSTTAKPAIETRSPGL